jgi:hypothetical protein
MKWLGGGRVVLDFVELLLEESLDDGGVGGDECGVELLDGHGELAAKPAGALLDTLPHRQTTELDLHLLLFLLWH